MKRILFSGGITLLAVYSDVAQEGIIRRGHDRVVHLLEAMLMMERIAEVSPRLKARIAGGLYLTIIVGGIFAEIFVRGRLVVHGNAAATAHNIVTHELLY